MSENKDNESNNRESRGPFADGLRKGWQESGSEPATETHEPPRESLMSVSRTSQRHGNHSGKLKRVANEQGKETRK